MENNNSHIETWQSFMLLMDHIKRHHSLSTVGNLTSIKKTTSSWTSCFQCKGKNSTFTTNFGHW